MFDEAFIFLLKSLASPGNTGIELSAIAILVLIMFLRKGKK